ncbi:hypothetical protein HDE_06254 [Halotydeus destructor]|nr:hypothetical protein HDE_06254 [Halotydeus destructor]
MTLLNLALLSCAFSLVTSSIPYCSYCAVQNLVAEPDYRAVKLTWKYLYAREPPGFRIRQKYLPVSSAIQSRIIEKDDANLQHLDKLVRFDRNTYQASVFDLRMVTNYTFSVEADFSLTHDPAIGDSFHKFGIHANNPLNINEARAKQYNVTVETKGFSGKTMVCLSNATEVIVHTGPYFNGKISVENVPDDGCSVFGNHSSPLDTYTLTIHHGRCGSQIVRWLH